MHNASFPVAARVYDDVAPALAPLPDALGARFVIALHEADVDVLEVLRLLHAHRLLAA